ncbi:MAG: glycosyltransferase [Christiangramia sp.]|nr:glycosyltransferase [Christiangramia sp.]
MESNSWNRFDENTQVYYFSKENLSFKNIKNLIYSTEFDSAYVNGIYSPYFSIMPVYLLKKLNKPTVVAARGMLNSQAFSVKPLKKKIFIEAAKVIRLHTETFFHATNEEEKEYIKRILPHSKGIVVAPNLPRKAQKGAIPVREKETFTKFVSAARVAREKGTLTALKALSKSKLSGKIVYDIYGPVYDKHYWEECRELIHEMPENIQVNYKGSIESNKVPGILKDYHFFLMPSVGENFGHGILEAFTAGCPVIISNNTPWTELKKKKIGWNCALDSGDLVSAIERAATMGQKEYKEWSQASFEFATAYCNNSEALEASRRLFKI